MHPEVRFQERMLVLGPRRPVGRGRSVWSEEEEELVVEFGANHGFFGVYAPVIAARLSGKSYKQIRKKVRTMGRLPHGAFEEETIREEELTDAPPSSPSEAFEGPARSSGDESKASAERDAAVLEFDEWERNPREEWLRSEQRNPLGEELKREWEEFSEPSAAWLDGFALRVTETFLNSDPGDAGRRREGRRARTGRAGMPTLKNCIKDVRLAWLISCGAMI